MSRRWTYQVIEIKPRGLMGGFKEADIQAELNRHGQLGWELVNIINVSPMKPAMLVSKKEI